MTSGEVVIVVVVVIAVHATNGLCDVMGVVADGDVRCVSPSCVVGSVVGMIGIRREVRL